MTKPTILLVEQDRMLSDMYAMYLQADYEVHEAVDAQAAIDVLDSHSVDCVITDSVLGFHNGIELIHELKSYQDWQSIPIILLSSVPLTHIPKRQWLRYGIGKILYKPHVDLAGLQTTISASVNQ